MEEVNKSLPFIGLNEAAYHPWVHNSWSCGRLKYKFINNKLYIVVEWDGKKQKLQGYFDVVMNNLPEEIAEAFLYSLDHIQ